MLYRDVTPRGLVGALLGFFEGLILACGVVVVWLMFANKTPNSTNAPVIAGIALAGGLVLALGRGLSGRMLGAGMGSICGILIGLPVSQLLPMSWDPVQIKTGSEEKEPFALAGPTLDGKQLDLADYRGKIVLIDFWATWCGPCIGELPNVRKAYDLYHDQGFEVIAVSLDHEREELANYVRHEELPWPQVFFDEPATRGWNNPLARKYGIDGIPATFLIDREGRLLTRDLRGKELIDEVGRQIDPATNGPPKFGRNAVTVTPVRFYFAGGCGVLLGAFLGALLQRRARPGFTTP